MTQLAKTTLLLMIISLLMACQSGKMSSVRDDDESRYADEQDREAYLNSPGYLNVQLGVEYMKQKDFALALSKLKKALRFSPDLAIAHTTIAVLYEEMGENDLAEKHYKRSIELDANDPRLRNNYGQYLCRHHSERQGIEQLQMAANNPLYKFPQIPLANAGICAMRINELEQADVFLRKALEIQPTHRPALLNMMRLNVQQGNYLQGRAYLQRYMAVAQHNAETLWAGYQIEQNLGDKSAAANYAVRLKSRYPDSAQTQLLLKEISNR